MLRRAGYRVRTTSDGEAALVLLRSASFDLLLTDVQMPRMDGFELASRARAEDPELRVILMPGHVGPESDDDRVEHPLLSKPFAAETLYRAVESILR